MKINPASLKKVTPESARTNEKKQQSRHLKTLKVIYEIGCRPCYHGSKGVTKKVRVDPGSPFHKLFKNVRGYMGLLWIFFAKLKKTVFFIFDDVIKTRQYLKIGWPLTLNTLLFWKKKKWAFQKHQRQSPCIFYKCKLNGLNLVIFPFFIENECILP